MKIWVNWSILISVLFATFSCDSRRLPTDNSEPNHNPYILQPGRNFQAKTKTIHLDSLSTLDTISLKKEFINPGKLISYPLNTNIQAEPKPKSYPLATETFPGNLQPVEIEIREVPLKWPEWEEANLGFQEGGKYNFSYLNVNRGLKSNFIWSLLEDRNGYIWIGTWGGGVSVWDGKGFRHLKKENGLAENNVVDLMEDSHGNIWMAHPKFGVISMWDGESIKQIYLDPNKGQNDNIWSLFEDQRGNIWIGGTELYQLRISSQPYEAIRVNNEEIDQIWKILEDSNGKLWINGVPSNQGSQELGLFCWDGMHLTSYKDPSRTVVSSGFGFIHDKSGNFRIGTSAGVGLIRMEEDQPRMEVRLSHLNGVDDFLEDSNGNIWIARGGGLHRLSHSISTQFEEIQSFSRSEGLTSKIAFRLLEDQFGNLWIGTQGEGVAILRNNAFEHFALEDELTSSFVYGMLQSHDGKIILGNELSVWGQKDYQKFQPLSQSLISPVWWNGMRQDTSGNIWIGTNNSNPSIWKWTYPLSTSNSFTRYQIPKDAGVSDFRAILIDRQKQSWFFSFENMYKGIINATGDLQALVPIPLETYSPPVQNYEDKKGRIWFLSEMTLPAFLLDGAYTYFTNTEQFQSKDFRSSTEDAQGNLWIASHDGLFIWDGKRFTHYTENEGLLNNTLRYLAKDVEDNIWAGSVQGLTKFHWKEQEQHWTMEHFESIDGLATPSINKLFVGQEQKLWMATTNGFSSLDLKQLEADTIAPSLSIEEIQPLQGFVDWPSAQTSLNTQNDSLGHTFPISFEGTQIDSIAPFYNLPVNPIFPHHINDFSIRWSAKAAKPHRLQYSYVLVRNDSKAAWSGLVKDHAADYRGLPSGNYVFKVRAVGGNGKWSETASYAFTIRPPWWQTWWAYVGYILLGATLVWGIVRLQTYSLRTRVLERTQEIRVQQKRSDELLLNILPATVANELKNKGKTQPVFFEEVSIMFADFKGFTNIVASISGKKLVSELDEIFHAYDDIMEEVGLEKIQTVGDAYLAAGGLPNPDPDHAKKCVIAAQKIIAFLEERNKTEAVKWKVRIGIHTGAITAGVIGRKKFSYDLFGDTINVAARIESASEPGKINISAMTYDQVKGEFPCTYRGKIDAKGKGELDMYFVD